MQHVIESQQFNRKTIDEIFKLADSLEDSKNKQDSLRGKIMASLFYEPSTRTRLSFESAMYRLGGEVISTENAGEFSSAAKGESLEDSIRTVNHYADIIVLRHNTKGASLQASKVSDVPIINAGDGSGQHPTQALLDLYTIEKELGGIDGLHIAMVGDLKYGRTVRSLSYLLGKFENIKITYFSPKQLKIEDDIKRYLDKHNVSWEEKNNWNHTLSKIDVLYQTRIQKERFENKEAFDKLKSSYVITSNEVGQMKENSVIMHPLPRVNEIDTEVDASPKAAYFRQAKYGLLVRMALLQYLFK